MNAQPERRLTRIEAALLLPTIPPPVRMLFEPSENAIPEHKAQHLAALVEAKASGAAVILVAPMKEGDGKRP